MLLPTVRNLAATIKELENSFQEPESERLEVWRKLVLWFAWARRYDDWQSEFERLPLGDPIRELQHSLLWSFRFFAVMIPESLKVGDWVDKAKMCISTYIDVCLSEGIPADELSQEQYFDWCIEWTIAQLEDVEAWAEYDQARERERFEAQLSRERSRASYGNQEAVQWLKENDPDFSEGDYVQNSVVANATTQPDEVVGKDGHEPIIIPQPESEARGEVPNNGVITLEYIGGSVGFNIATITGPQPVVRGQRYTVSGETWANIQEFAIGKWRKIS